MSNGKFIPLVMDNWHHLKQLTRAETAGAVKWWTGTRFNGHTTKQKRRCSCQNNPILTSEHILSCQVYDQAFEATANITGTLTTTIKELLSTRRFPDWEVWL